MHLRRQPPRRADAHRQRRRGAEGASTCRDPQGRARVVPGLLRARRRLRPRQPAHPGRARRRRLRGQRPEDLDQLRATWPTSAGDARAHRPRGAEAQGHHLAHLRHAHAGHRHPPDPDHEATHRVLRGLLRRRAGPVEQRRRRARTTVGASPCHAELRARHRVRVRRARVDGAGARPRRAGEEAITSNGATRWEDAGLADERDRGDSPARPRSTRCGRSPSATSRRRSAPASSAWAATCSRSRGPTCASTSATSPVARSTSIGAAASRLDAVTARLPPVRAPTCALLRGSR